MDPAVAAGGSIPRVVRMLRSGHPFVSAAVALALTATAFLARAQDPGQTPSYVWRLSGMGIEPADPAAARAGFPGDVFRTTLAPLQEPGGAQRDVPPQARSESARERKWSLAVESYTHAPVDIGGGLLLETPFGLRLSSGLGWIPPGYLNLVANVATNASGTGGATGAVVRNGLDGGTVWRAQVGIRPIGGLYFDGGYARVRLHGALTANDIAPAAGVPVAGTGLENAGYSLHSTIHMWIAEAGWQARIGGRVLLCLGIGVMGTMSSSTQAAPDFSLGETPQAKALSQAATDRIDVLVQRYGFVPTIHARLGFDLL